MYKILEFLRKRNEIKQIAKQSRQLDWKNHSYDEGVNKENYFTKGALEIIETWEEGIIWWTIKSPDKEEKIIVGKCFYIGNYNESFGNYFKINETTYRIRYRRNGTNDVVRDYRKPPSKWEVNYAIRCLKQLHSNRKAQKLYSQFQIYKENYNQINYNDKANQEYYFNLGAKQITEIWAYGKIRWIIQFEKTSIKEDVGTYYHIGMDTYELEDCFGEEVSYVAVHYKDKQSVIETARAKIPSERIVVEKLASFSTKYEPSLLRTFLLICFFLLVSILGFWFIDFIFLGEVC